MIDYIKDEFIYEIEIASSINKIYAFISFVITIISMIFTKCSPAMLLGFFSSIFEEIFPFFAFYNVGTTSDSYESLKVWLLIVLTEWLLTFISYIIQEELEEDCDIFTWIGNVFVGIFLSVLQVALIKKGLLDDFIGYWFVAVAIVLVAIILISVVSFAINEASPGFLGALEITWTFIKYILMGMLYLMVFPMLSTLIPAIIVVFILLIVTLLTIWIPIPFIQVIADIITLFVLFIGYYFIAKNSEWITGKIVDITSPEPFDIIVPVGRGILALVIVFSMIWVITGHTLPLWPSN